MHRLIIISSFFIGFYFPVSGQSEFDVMVDSIFFHLPRLASIEEINYSIISDSTFFDVKYPDYDPNNRHISARFTQNLMLHFMPDTSEFTYSSGDRNRVFYVRKLIFYYGEQDGLKPLNQLKELFDYFEAVAFFWEELPDHDKYPGESYSFYGDKKSFSKKIPRVNLHSNYFAPKDPEKEGHYLISLFFTEERI
jgi:hypothetical protein